MLLHTIEIENYRSLENVKLDNLRQFNVLIGRNNAGKSSVFQALYDLNNILNNRGMSSDVMTDRDMSRSLEINLTFKLSPQEQEEIVDKLVAADFDMQRKKSILESPFLRMVRFSFKAPAYNLGLKYLQETSILAEDGQWATVQKMTGNEQTAAPDYKYVYIATVSRDATNSQSLLEAALFNIDQTSKHTTTQVNYNQILTTSWATDPVLQWLYTHLNNFFLDAFFFNPFRHSTPVLGVAQTDILAQDGVNLPQVLHTILANDRDTFEAIERFIQAALPDVGRLQTPLGGSTTNIVFRATGKNYLIPLTDMGGGIEQLLMIATVLMMPRTQNSTLFIEEPESHLHAGAQRFLIEQLYAGKQQVFITTHSPTFVNILQPHSLYQVINTKGRTNIKRCDLASLDMVLEDIGVRNSDVLLSDAVLFVEGNSDEEVLTLFSEKLKMGLAEKNVNVLPMGGGKHAERGAPLRSDLLKDISNKAPIPHMFLLDRDERRTEEIHSLERRLGDKVHFFMARELENYLLVPRAILNALKSKYRDDPAILEKLAAVTEERIDQIIYTSADDLYDTVLIKRIRTELGGLRDGLLPSAVTSSLLPHARKPDLSKLVLETVQSQFTQHIAGLDIESIVSTERQELDAAWADPEKRVQLAPGEEILAAIFKELELEYKKRTDTPRIAREMQTDEIHQEIIEIINKARALTGDRNPVAYK